MAVKLDKAEKDALVKIAKIDEILAYRSESDKLSKYNQGEKIHEKQIAFHKCQKKNRWVFGGNRSGKTECGAVEAVWWARGIHPYRENRKDVSGWVVSVSYEVQREVAQLKVLSYLKREWIEETAELEFDGFRFFAPGGYDHVLREIYGDYMQLPPEEKRVPSHSDEIDILQEGEYE